MILIVTTCINGVILGAFMVFMFKTSPSKTARREWDRCADSFFYAVYLLTVAGRNDLAEVALLAYAERNVPTFEELKAMQERWLIQEEEQ